MADYSAFSLDAAWPGGFAHNAALVGPASRWTFRTIDPVGWRLPQLENATADVAGGKVRVGFNSPVRVANPPTVIHSQPEDVFDIGTPVAVNSTDVEVPLTVRPNNAFDQTPGAPAGLAYPLPAFTLQPPAGRAVSSDPPPPPPTGRADVE